MGIFGKLAFLKKKDEFDLGLDKGGDLGPDLGMGDMGMSSHGMPPMGHDAGMGKGSESYGPDPFAQRQPSFGQSQYPSYPQQQPFQQNYPQPPSYGDSGVGKDIEVISSKLDALRALMDSINQRLANLEHIARGDEDDRRQRRW